MHTSLLLDNQNIHVRAEESMAASHRLQFLGAYISGLLFHDCA